MEIKGREIINLEKYIEMEKNKFVEKYENNSDELVNDITSMSDYMFVNNLRSGSFSHLVLVQHKLSRQMKTVKLISTDALPHRRQQVINEKKIMTAMGTFPFTVKLESWAKNDNWVYLIMPLVSVGNLFEVLVEHGPFKESIAKLYMAQIVLGLEFLHASGLVYRNMKLDNVLININGYVRLANFGITKQIGRGRTYTLCGTPDYMAPEMITFKGYSQAVDYWSLGVMLYEMVVGRTPFVAQELEILFEKITRNDYEISVSFSKSLQNIIRGLVQPNLSRRLGNLKNGFADIKDHSWFRGIDWLQIINQKKKMPFEPHIKFESNIKDQMPFGKNKKEFVGFKF